MAKANAAITQSASFVAPSLALAKFAGSWATVQTADVGRWVASNAKKASDAPLTRKIVDSRLSQGAAERFTRATEIVKTSRPVAAVGEWSLTKKIASRFG